MASKLLFRSLEDRLDCQQSKCKLQFYYILEAHSKLIIPIFEMIKKKDDEKYAIVEMGYKEATMYEMSMN